jgi:hypothetical protein
MEDVGIFYGHLVHFTVFCYILWTFGIVRGNLVYFSRFGILYQIKIWQPWILSKKFPLNYQARSFLSSSQFPIDVDRLVCNKRLKHLITFREKNCLFD